MIRLLLYFLLAWSSLGSIEAFGERKRRPLQEKNEEALHSTKSREIAAARDAALRELSLLPLPASAPTSVRMGWHSKVIRTIGNPIWVQVDLGRPLHLDVVALVPANGAAQDVGGPGYGFPVRFRVDAGNDEKFELSESVADETGADVPNPGGLPLVFAVGGRTARYVRVTVTKPWPRGDDWIIALGELMVLSDGRNVAAGQPVSVSASSSVISPPTWESANLTDGQSLLGPPVARESSPTNGYLAIHESEADVRKWVQIDLEKPMQIDAVRIFPARPYDFADTPGNGFPVQFSIDASNEVGFETAVTLFDTGDENFVNPGDNPVTVQKAVADVRYVRVTARRLHARGTTTSFALGEMEVWSRSRNVALGKPVTALDQFADKQFPRWSRQYLVDGFNSKNRILNDTEWLWGLARRGKLMHELASLDQQRIWEADATLKLVARVGMAAVGGVLVVACLWIWRARATRRQAVEALRRTIASDLHDEIGSNLGSIALLAEAARRDGTGAHGHTTEDFAMIERIAEATNKSLREIVWFIEPSAMTRSALIARMREAAPSLLGEVPFEFHAPPSMKEGECPLAFARNVWLVFKEALHNAAKHSKASLVTIRVMESAKGFEMTVQDDGHGFVESQVEPGHGLVNSRRRAAELHGTLHVSSEPGHGTRIHLHIPRV